MAKKASYVRRVEGILYNYRSIIAGMENEIELEAEGLGSIFPSIAQYGGIGGGRSNIPSTPTERLAIVRAEKSLQVRQIDRALRSLTTVQFGIVERKFFDPTTPLDSEVCKSLGLGNTAYYKAKRSAIRNIAVALNLI